MSRSRYVPLLVAFACGLVPLCARYDTAKADIFYKGPCTRIVQGCVEPDPTVGGCLDGTTTPPAYPLPDGSGPASCEIVTLIPVYLCSLGSGSCSLKGSANCASLAAYLGGPCNNGKCPNNPPHNVFLYDRATCAVAAP